MTLQLRQLAVVGVGLIGGSVARAARLRGVAARVVGIDTDAGHRERAVRLGLLDEASADLRAAAAAEVVVFCTPVDRIAAGVRELAPACAAGTLLTDAGSTKAAIVRAVGPLPAGIAFVGSHPLAGSEKHGPEHADADLFQGRLAVVPPTPQTDPEAVGRVTALWEALGARVRLMDPEEHDRALALTSHLPHVVASALAGVLPPELYGLAATGFRDTTRLAASNPGLWAAICLQNAPALLEALAQFGDLLEGFRMALAASDGERLAELFGEGKRIKQELEVSERGG